MSDSDEMRGQILANLRAITTLADQLRDRAIDQATHPLIPGGEAMANLAGCASLEGWANRNDYRERQGIFDDGIEDPEDLWLPIQRLWFWSEAWREEHSQPTDLRPTLHTEAEFLVKIVDWIISHEPRLEDFRADVARTRWQLEDITRDGERPTRSRVRCEDCEGGRGSSKCGPRSLERTAGSVQPAAETSLTTNTGAGYADKSGNRKQHAGSPPTRPPTSSPT